MAGVADLVMALALLGVDELVTSTNAQQQQDHKVANIKFENTHNKMTAHTCTSIQRKRMPNQSAHVHKSEKLILHKTTGNNSGLTLTLALELINEHVDVFVFAAQFHAASTCRPS